MFLFLYGVFMKKKVKNVGRKNSRSSDTAVGYRKDSTISPLISNIPKVSFFFFFVLSGWARMALCFGVFHVPVALQKLARCGKASRTRLYIKWCSRFTSQIESRAIGRFSISLNNGLCYTSSTFFGSLFSFSSSRRPAYFRRACFHISPQERIHRASRCWGFVSTIWYP